MRQQRKKKLLLTKSLEELKESIDNYIDFTDFNSYNSNMPQELKQLKHLDKYIANSVNKEVNQENYITIRELKEDLITSLVNNTKDTITNKLLLNEAIKNNPTINNTITSLNNKIVEIKQEKDNTNIANITKEKEEKEEIEVEYENDKFIITAIESNKNSNLLDFTVQNKSTNEITEYKSEPIFSEHNYNESEFSKHIKSFYYNEQFKDVNFGKVMKNLNNQYKEQKNNKIQKLIKNDGVIINDKICYISKNNDKFHLNYYNPKAEAYEMIPINNEKDTLNWLNTFRGVLTNEDLTQNQRDNDFLWNNININKHEINKLNEINHYKEALNMKVTVTQGSLIIQILKLKGFVICSNNDEVYRFDEKSKSYIHYNKKDIIEFVNKEINNDLDNNLNKKVITEAINSLGIYKDIHHNILTFTNGYYDTDSWTFKENEEYTAGIPYYSFDYNYNQEATIKKDSYFHYYWNNYESQLQQDLLEFIGLLLVKGNPLKKLFLITGTTDSGKTILINILKSILKSYSDIPLTAINKGGHELGALLNSNVNFMNDESNDLITNNSIIKRLSGNDDIFVNAKYKTPITLKNYDVPKMIGIFNNLPNFKQLETALKNRLGIIIMNTLKIIPKNKQIRDLDQLIINESDNIEWLLYNTLNSAHKILTDDNYKPNWDMYYKNNNELNDILVKNSQPIRYFLEKGFIYTGERPNFSNENTTGKNDFISKEDMNTFLNKCEKLEKVQIIDRTNNGNIKPKTICGFISDIFSIDNYKPKYKKKNGEPLNGYYCLVPTQYYYDIMCSY